MNLIVIDSEGNKLADAAAASFMRMLNDGMPREDVTVGWRSREEQERLHAGWVNRVPGFNFALPPGQSRHEVGFALDVAEPMRSWMAAHGSYYGWRRTNSREPWHFEYFYSEDKSVGRVTPPTPITPEDDDMPYTDADRAAAAATRQHAANAEKNSYEAYKLMQAAAADASAARQHAANAEKNSYAAWKLLNEQA